MKADPQKVRSVFLAAVENHAPDQWNVFLDDACGGDPELRQRVDVLLSAHQQANRLLDAPVLVLAATADRPLHEGPGTVIGPYKLLQQIGEGGMGTVFMAEQTQPVQRMVALKVIKPGMDSRQVIARFEAERQALAMMDHVNIARVLDAGTTESGLPYFVMELVHGVPITKYCDDARLTPRERLELFVPVCQAIQHAHQKGIIHRDIKPSNVMITLYDGKPVPKVIDFGVAKATEQKLTERTLFTQYGAMVGTPEYMSPEQAEMSALGVDTRSDIYSLGVLLYELLTGSTPLSHKRVKHAAYAEILRMIKEEEPPKPSTRLSDSGEALASISANRHMEPAKLTKLVKGELDWIVMKCLEKDRNRRYDSASGFAADVQRYLTDEAVLACPPSAWYRFRKFARRNKATLIPLAAIAFVLVLGTAISAWQAVRATEQAVRATKAETDADEGWAAEKTERDRALKAERKAKERLHEARLAQVDAAHWSGQPGQRFASLAALAETATLISELNLGPDALVDLRNRAIVSLTRTDLRLPSEKKSQKLKGTLIEHVNASKRYVSLYGLSMVMVQSRADAGAQYRIDLPGSGSVPRLSPCGRHLVVHGRWVQVWDVDRQMLVLKVPEPVTMDISANFRRLVVGMPDESLQAFDLPMGNEVKRIDLGAPKGSQLYVQPGGARVAVVRNSEVQILDLTTGGVVATQTLDGLSGPRAVWHPHGKMLALFTNAQILLWVPGSSQKPQVLEGHPKVTNTIAFNHGGTLLASPCQDGTIRLWDVWTGKQLLKFHFPASDVAFTANDEFLAYRGSRDDVGYLEVATGRECRTLVSHPQGELDEIDISPDGRWIAALAGSRRTGHRIRLWDLQSGKEADVPPIAASSIAFDPSTGDLVAPPARSLEIRYAVKGNDAGNGDATLVPVTAAVQPNDFRPRGQFLFAVPGDPNPKRSAVSADGRWLVKGVFGPPPFAPRLGLPQTRKAFSPPMPVPTLIDRKTGAIHALPGDGEVGVGTQVALSPDARQLVVASPTNCYVWHVDPLKRSAVIAQQKANSSCPVAYSPEGKMLAVAQSQWDVKLIDPESLEEFATLRAPDPEVLTWLCFSPDGSRLAACVQGGRIQVWDIRDIRRQLAAVGLDWKLRPWGLVAGK